MCTRTPTWNSLIYNVISLVMVLMFVIQQNMHSLGFQTIFFALKNIILHWWVISSKWCKRFVWPTFTMGICETQTFPELVDTLPRNRIKFYSGHSKQIIHEMTQMLNLIQDCFAIFNLPWTFSPYLFTYTWMLAVVVVVASVLWSALLFLVLN